MVPEQHSTEYTVIYRNIPEFSCPHSCVPSIALEPDVLLSYTWSFQIAFELNKEYLNAAKLPAHSIRTRYISPSTDCLLCPGGGASTWNTYVVYLDIAGAIDDPSYDDYVKKVSNGYRVYTKL